MKKLVLHVFLLLLLLLTACSGETPAVSGTPAATTVPQTDGGTVLTVLSWNPPLDGALDALSGTLAEKGLSLTFDVRLLRPDSPSQTVKAYAEQLPQSDLTMFYDYAAMCAVYDEGLLADLSGYADACPLLFASASKDRACCGDAYYTVSAFPSAGPTGIRFLLCAAVFRNAGTKPRQEQHFTSLICCFLPEKNISLPLKNTQD